MLSEAMSASTENVVDETEIAGREAGVHGEDRAGYAGRRVGGEEQGGAGDLFGRHQPAERIMRQDAVEEVRRSSQAVVPGRRSYRTGADDIGANPRRAALNGDGLGVGDKARLRRRIGRIAVMGERVDGGDENDRTAAAPLHRGERGRDDVEGAGQVDGELALPGGLVDIRSEE